MWKECKKFLIAQEERITRGQPPLLIKLEKIILFLFFDADIVPCVLATRGMSRYVPCFYVCITWSYVCGILEVFSYMSVDCVDFHVQKIRLMWNDTEFAKLI